ncbi:gp53-like domain-containing protein [Enterobacter cloacae]|uniref:gp53-like domain-containing protein n=1 Tax=Enterobacter cloacae TaxID=550 RepID=UPI003D1DF1E1
MNFTDIPARILKAFGLNGLKNTIPTDSSTSTDNNGVATFDKGFPPITMQPLSAGGIPPSGKDMNGILYALSLKEQWADAGMSYPFNSDFATAISGYPKGAVLLNSQQSGKWLNLTDGNSTSPESLTGASTGWVPLDNYGVTNIAGLAATNVTLSSLQAAKERIVLTGTLTSNIAIIFPAWMASWTVVNNCTGAFTVTCRTASGSGITAATGTTEKLYCDGLNITREFGTAAQRNVGNLANQIPDMSFFNSSNSINGNCSLPNGLIQKWGEVNTSLPTLGITFDSPFPSACIYMVPTHLIENTNDYVFAQVVSRNASGGSIGIYRAAQGSAPQANALPVTVGWMALGY